MRSMIFNESCCFLVTSDWLQFNNAKIFPFMQINCEQKEQRQWGTCDQSPVRLGMVIVNNLTILIPLNDSISLTVSFSTLK